MSDEPERTNDVPMRLLHRVGINIGIFVMASASVLAFLLALIRLIGAIVFLFDSRPQALESFFSSFGVEGKPFILMLLDIVDTSILASILLIFAFGLRSVFLGYRHEMAVFDIRDIDKLKEYLIGLVVTLMATQFLEFIFITPSGTQALTMGIGIAAVIIALAIYTYILRQRTQVRGKE